MVTIYTKVDNGQAGSDRRCWLHRDRLGSVDTVTDAEARPSRRWRGVSAPKGEVVEKLSYHAFGRRRDAGTWLPATAYIEGQETERGFTGHEEIDDAELVPMGGRVYDPVLGRFLSADPFIQDATDLRGLNRYSYVRNNPLSLTDPSGFFSLGGLWRPLVAISLAVIAPIALPAYPVLAGALAGARGGYIATGTWSGALIGGATGAAFGALHGWSVPNLWSVGPGEFSSALAQNLAKVVAHGLVGGFGALGQGGDFATGFFAAAFSEAATLGGVYDRLSGGAGLQARVGRVAIAAAIGGTAAAVVGGDPAMGALIAAYSRFLNEEAGNAKYSELNKLNPLELAQERFGYLALVAGGAALADTPAPGPADIVAGLILLAGGLYIGGQYLHDQWVHANSNQSMRGSDVYHLVNNATGEIDKIGVTSRGQLRYPQWYYRAENVRYVRIRSYQWRYAAKIDENIQLVHYQLQHGRLPRLNRTTY